MRFQGALSPMFRLMKTDHLISIELSTEIHLEKLFQLHFFRQKLYKFSNEGLGLLILLANPDNNLRRDFQKFFNFYSRQI
jgi:hypothetical protein